MTPARTSASSEIGDALLRFLQEECGLEKGSIGPKTVLFSSGLLDSFALISVLVFMEENFGVRVPSVDLTPSRIDSVNALTKYVMTLRGGQ